MPLLIIITIVILGYVFGKNIFINLLQCFLCISFFAYSQDGYDHIVYEYIYNTVAGSGESEYEVGYVWLNKFISVLGFNYLDFRLIIGLLFITPLFILVRHISRYPNVVWSSFIIYSAMFDGCLLRNSISMMLSIVGIYTLINTKSRNELIIPAICFIFAALFHSAYWIMMLFIPSWLFLKGGKKIKLFLIIVGCLYVIFAFNSTLLFNLYSHLAIRESTIDKYQTDNYANIIGFIYDIVRYLFILSPVFIFKENSTIQYKGSNGYPTFMTSAILLNILFSVILIPQFFAVNFNRLFRIQIFYNYIYVSNQIKRNNVVVPRLFCLGYSLILLLLVLFFESPSTLNDILFMHLTTNSFLLYF